MLDFQLYSNLLVIIHTLYEYYILRVYEPVPQQQGLWLELPFYQF